MDRLTGILSFGDLFFFSLTLPLADPAHGRGYQILNAALASVPYGVVLVRVRARVNVKREYVKVAPPPVPAQRVAVDTRGTHDRRAFG